jgi:hypothetical protein
MSRMPLLKDIRRLSRSEARGNTTEHHRHHVNEILERIAGLRYSDEMWEMLVTHNGQPPQ